MSHNTELSTIKCLFLLHKSILTNWTRSMAGSLSNNEPGWLSERGATNRSTPRMFANCAHVVLYQTRDAPFILVPPSDASWRPVSYSKFRYSSDNDATKVLRKNIQSNYHNRLLLLISIHKTGNFMVIHNCLFYNLIYMLLICTCNNNSDYNLES